MADEQQLFLRAMWAPGQDAHQRYSHMDPRISEQLQACIYSCACNYDMGTSGVVLLMWEVCKMLALH